MAENTLYIGCSIVYSFRCIHMHTFIPTNTHPLVCIRKLHTNTCILWLFSFLSSKERIVHLPQCEWNQQLRNRKKKKRKTMSYTFRNEFHRCLVSKEPCIIEMESVRENATSLKQTHSQLTSALQRTWQSACRNSGFVSAPFALSLPLLPLFSLKVKRAEESRAPQRADLLTHPTEEDVSRWEDRQLPARLHTMLTSEGHQYSCCFWAWCGSEASLNGWTWVGEHMFPTDRRSPKTAQVLILTQSATVHADKTA